MNLANKLTMLRVILVPIFLIFLIGKGIPYGSIIATLIFIIASLTDQLDGYIARSRNQITNFGKFMDPLADKLLTCSAMIAMISLNLIPSWVVIVIIAREFTISGFRLIASDNGKVIAANMWGKVKTTVQMIMIIYLIVKVAANWDSLFFNVVAQVLIYAALALTVISLMTYILGNKDVLSSSK